MIEWETQDKFVEDFLDMFVIKGVIFTLVLVTAHVSLFDDELTLRREGGSSEGDLDCSSSSCWTELEPKIEVTFNVSGTELEPEVEATFEVSGSAGTSAWLLPVLGTANIPPLSSVPLHPLPQRHPI